MIWARVRAERAVRCPFRPGTLLYFNMKRVVLVWMVLIGAIDLVAMQWHHAFLPDAVPIAIDRARVLHDEGFAYAIPLDLDAIAETPIPAGRRIMSESDMTGMPKRSSLILLEDGRRLPYRHALHRDIQEIGKGRYSHWNSYIMFAASDSSDPRTNGRTYVALIPVCASWPVLFGLAVINLSGLICLRFVSTSVRRVLFVSLGIIAALGFAKAGLKAELVTFIDTMLPPLFFCIAILGAVASWLTRIRSNEAVESRVLRRVERRLHAIAIRWGLAASIIACGLSVVTVWGMEPGLAPETHNFYAAFLGHVPATDAGGYHLGGQHLIDRGELDPWNHRRPINGALMAVRLAMFGLDIRLATLLQAALLGAALYWCAMAVGRMCGVWSGLAMYAMLFAEAQYHGPSLLSEALGLTFACLGTTLLLHGLNERSLSRSATGLFGLSVAMAARPGALFVLPAVWLALLFRFRQPWRRLGTTAVVAGLALVMGLSLNRALVFAYGTGEGIPNENFSYVALGLAQNVLWSEADAAFRTELTPLSAPERASFRYEKAWELIRDDHRPFVAASMTALQNFGATVKPRLASQVLPFERMGVRADARLVNTLTVLLAVGLIITGWRLRDRLTMLMILTMLGVIASIPFIFMNGRYRVLSSAFPLIALPIAASLCVMFKHRGHNDEGFGTHGRPAATLLGVLVIVSLIGPWIAHAVIGHPHQTARAQDDDWLVTRSVTALSAVAVVDEGVELPWSMPSLTPARFEQLARLANREDHDVLMELTPPFAFLVAYNHCDGAEDADLQRIVIVDLEDLYAFRSKYVALRFERVHASNMFRVIETRSLP